MLSTILSLSYALFIPPGERRDESYHYQVIDYLASTGRFPDSHSMTEAYQPPLYYYPMALIKIVAAGPESQFATMQLNEYYYFSDRRLGFDQYDNLNFYLHPKSHWIPTNDPLTIGSLAVRLLNVLLGLLNLLVSYALCMRAWPQTPHRRLLAMGLLAGWSSLQYTFGAINNDNAVIVMSTVCLWLMVRQYQNGPTWTSSIVLGLALGGALLSKVAGLILIVPCVMLVDLSGWRTTWRYFVVILLVMVATAGWWYVWKFIAVNDPLGLSAAYTLFPELRAGPNDLVRQLDPIRLSRWYSNLWLSFGNEPILMPRPFYWVYDAVFLLGVTGAIRRLARREPPVRLISIPAARIVGLFVAAMGAGYVYYAITNMVGNSGRHLLQGSTAFAICIAYGVDQWLTTRLRPYAWSVISTLLIGASAICLYVYYIPAFKPQAAPASIEQPLNYQYGDVVKLIGVKEVTLHAVPGEWIPVTLYWRALETGTDDLVVEFSSIPTAFYDRRSFPGAGTFLASGWLAGDRWTDSYSIPILRDAQSGTYQILVRIIHKDSGVLEISTTPDGNFVTPVVITLTIDNP